MFHGLRISTAVIALLVGLAPPGAASTDSSVSWTTLSESTTCGAPYVATPIMSRIGSLADSDRILGPFGSYFGRTVGEVRTALVDWTVPMSGGQRVRVHRAALPAFEQVSANLAAAAAQGFRYSVTTAAAFTPRTIGGSHQLSRHALGTSIDINPGRNPYSPNPGSLVTDMPEWFVQAWRAAGFCWGGDWAFSKDPMHFSWMGPVAGSGGLPALPPLGAPTSYSAQGRYATGWAGHIQAGTMAVADMTGSGAADVVRLRDHRGGLVVEILSARSAFSRCSLSRWFVEGLAIGDGMIALGDVDGDSRVDLVSVSPEGRLAIFRRTTLFEPAQVRNITMPTGVRSVLIADHDGDRRGDLYLVGDTVTILAGPDFTTQLATVPLPPSHATLMAGDRDGDGSVDLFSVDQSGSVSVLGRGADGLYVQTESTTINVAGAVAVAAFDFDGDRRADVAALGADGAVEVWVGNSPTGRPASSWWVDPGYECPDHTIPLAYRGVFFDDDESPYEFAIEAIAAAGVTAGCNPPFGDAFCPGRAVTRGEMATFLARALNLPPSHNATFTDVDGSSVHAGDIERIAAAGLTFGCGPSLFCPHAAVTRGEMASFLVRAAALPPAGAGEDPFVDDDGHPHEADIAALWLAGITQGCGPGLFCPNGAVTRGEMAVFITRLSGG
ncbi:MAG TPA: FG-GAP-like repeat-containing protein [Acidimicrobiia bacterium]|nr:FG-GAP-like repeat-containing protein [Acidimicrobiia bacterium]